jgi:hypothetical protein
MFSHLVRLAVAALVGTSFLVGMACTQPEARRSKKDAGEPFEEDDFAYEDDQEPETDLTTNSKDAGVISVPKRPNDGGTKDVYIPPVNTDAGTCSTGPGPGDLQIVELMIASKGGSGDNGEWVEIQNARDCVLNVRGVKISSPRGTAGVDAIVVNADLFVPPAKTFVVADDGDPSRNGGLPGPVVSWNTTDVLKNSGDTIELTAEDGTTIDKVTYPALDLGVSNYGTSLSFPVSCLWSDRLVTGASDINTVRWSGSSNAYGSGALHGTPNDDNWDVSCY